MDEKHTWREVRVDNWRDFECAMAPLRDQGHGVFRTFAFRGQCEASWPLTPSLTRLLQDYLKRSNSQLPSEPEYFEEYALHLFKTRAPLHVDTSRFIENGRKIDWLVLARHYGAPTRLLDWSWSPYVGAYFAALPSRDPDGNESDGALWCAPVNHVNAAAGGDSPRALMFGDGDALERVVKHVAETGAMFFIPRAHNTRTAAQQGLFSIAHDVKSSQERILAQRIQQFLDGPNVVGKKAASAFLFVSSGKSGSRIPESLACP